MKSKVTLFLGILTFSSFVLQSCENKAKHAGEAKETNVKIIQDEEEVFKDLFEFVAYKDDFEYTCVQAKKGNELHGFVNDKITIEVSSLEIFVKFNGKRIPFMLLVTAKLL